MSGSYRTTAASEAQITIVEPGDGRIFLVAQFTIREWKMRKTLVLQREVGPEYWISRRDIDGSVDPQDAVTGHLFRHEPPDPVDQMKRDLAVARRSNWELRNQVMKLKADAVAASRGKPKREGGKRGSRNS